jgi:hypothetical protein
MRPSGSIHNALGCQAAPGALSFLASLLVASIRSWLARGTSKTPLRRDGEPGVGSAP